MKSPWQREWEKQEGAASMKEIVWVVMIFFACYGGWKVYHKPAQHVQVNQAEMAGEAKYRAQAWLKGGADAD